MPWRWKSTLWFFWWFEYQNPWSGWLYLPRKSSYGI